MKKTFKQSMLNKAMDRCLNIIGNSRATVRQQEIALSILNKCYERSDVPIKLDSIGEIGLKGVKNECR